MSTRALTANQFKWRKQIIRKRRRSTKQELVIRNVERHVDTSCIIFGTFLEFFSYPLTGSIFKVYRSCVNCWNKKNLLCKLLWNWRLWGVDYRITEFKAFHISSIIFLNVWKRIFTSSPLRSSNKTVENLSATPKRSIVQRTTNHVFLLFEHLKLS